MRLKEYKVTNCFGFGEADYIRFDSPKEFYTVLGRNSSGKSSFLKALSFLEIGRKPNESKYFRNFNSKDEKPLLEAVFEVLDEEIDVSDMIERLKRTIASTGIISEEEIKADQNYIALFDLINNLYKDLFVSISKNGQVKIWKEGNGEYIFLTNEYNRDSYKERMQAITNEINNFYNNPTSQYRIGNKRIPLNFNANQIESFLFNQFPSIYFFDTDNKLVDEFPDRITLKDIQDDTYKNNELVSNFINFLGHGDVKNYLVSEDPKELSDTIVKLQNKANELANQVNKDIQEKNLLKIQLAQKEGLQITFMTEGKASYYYHLSEYTQLLFGYHLFIGANDFSDSIVMVDEPGIGLHPTVQSSLLELLKELAHSNQVIITTHSEYMIDTDDLTGIKIMSKDKEGRLYVRNDFHDQPKRKGDFLALQPLMTAIGLKIGSNLNAKNKVVITEGITDMYYLLAFKKILGLDFELNIAPSRSDTNILNLIPLLISQGIGFKVVLDINTNSQIAEKIRQDWGVEDKYIIEIPVPKKFVGKFSDSGIEDLFTKKDFAKQLSINEDELKKFEEMSNSKFIAMMSKDNNLKRSVAFNLYANKDELSSNYFENETIENFRNILESCKKNTWKKI